MKQKKELTKTELRKLYENKGLSQKEIAEKFEVKQSWISKKMKELDIPSRGHKKWSQKEEKVLVKNYLKVGQEKLLSLLPERTWGAIKLKAMKLGLSRTAEEYRHSEETKKRLRKFSDENTKKVKFEKDGELAYILGVLDGDGYTDRRYTLGLEVNSKEFADKFSENLAKIGLNPGRGKRRNQGREIVWASSKQLIEWYYKFTPESKERWLLENKRRAWKYIEGRYESDGNIHPSGSPRICSYDKKAIKFLGKILRNLGINCSEQQNNIWVSKKSADQFFENIKPVIRKRGS